IVSGLVTSPFDHSRIWSGLASEMRIALKLLTSSMVLLRVDAWLGDAIRTVSERRRAGRDPAPRVRAVLVRDQDRLVLEPGEVDPAEIGEHVPGRVVLRERDLLVVLVQDLRVQPEAAQLLDQDLERFGDPRRLDLLSLDDRLVGLDATQHVVRLHGQQLLEDVGRAVGLEGPDLHLSEALAAELGLAAQRLLGDEAVRAGRAGVDLVLHEVMQLEHVDIADGDRTVERLTGSAVAQGDLALLRQRLLLAI